MKEDEALLSHLEIHLKDICNLKCTICFHFSNLYDEDETTFESLERDLHQISKHAQVLRIKLLGGEPLLYEDISSAIYRIRALFPFSFLELTTNGLLLPTMPPEFFEAVKRNVNKLYISEYTPTTKIRDKIISMLNDYSITYEFGKVSRFVRKLLPENISVPWESFEHCGSRPCKMLRDGKIYICPMEAMIYKYINYFKLKEDFKINYDSLGISIYDELYQWKNLYRDLDKPSDMCSYCANGKIGGSELIPWTSGGKPDRNNWLCSWSL